VVRRELLTGALAGTLGAVLLGAAHAASAGPITVRPSPPYTLERSLVTQVETPTGRHYQLMVAWPEGEPPPGGWPVLYVLDGDDNFAAAVTTARRLAKAGARSGVEPGVIVGVASEDLARRVLDYTPAAPGYAIPAGAPASGLATGGADAFLDILCNVIQPQIAGHWRIDPKRQTLLGHSFGGLLALHALAVRPGQFQTYAAVSPSLWFGDGVVARELEAAKPPASVLIAAGDKEGGPGGRGPGAEALAASLKAAGVETRFLPLPGQTHGGTMFASLAEAVALAFRPADAR